MPSPGIESRPARFTRIGSWPAHALSVAPTRATSTARRTLEPRDIGGHADPALATAGPHVGVAAGAGLPVGPEIGGARVDEGHVAQHPDQHVLDVQAPHGGAAADLSQEAGAIHERAVGVAVHEILGEVGVEPLHVRLAD